MSLTRTQTLSIEAYLAVYPDQRFSGFSHRAEAPFQPFGRVARDQKWTRRCWRDPKSYSADGSKSSAAWYVDIDQATRFFVYGNTLNIRHSNHGKSDDEYCILKVSEPVNMAASGVGMVGSIRGAQQHSSGRRNAEM